MRHTDLATVREWAGNTISTWLWNAHDRHYRPKLGLSRSSLRGGFARAGDSTIASAAFLSVPEVARSTGLDAESLEFVRERPACFAERPEAKAAALTALADSIGVAVVTADSVLSS